jgi:GMP synthase (glutamine-hydrolysing)
MTARASVAVLQNDAEVPPGYLSDALREAGVQEVVFRVDKGEVLDVSRLDEFAAVVVLGGAQCAYDDAAWPELLPVKQLIRTCVQTERPFLGVCLGCQLLATALAGNEAGRLAERPELGYHHRMVLTPEGAADPVLSKLRVSTSDDLDLTLNNNLLLFHQDTFSPPEGAAVLARSDICVQAIRLGRRALGVQFHPEATTDAACAWMRRSSDAKRVAAGITDGGQSFCRDCEERQAASAAAARDFFLAWLREDVGLVW